MDQFLLVHENLPRSTLDSEVTSPFSAHTKHPRQAIKKGRPPEPAPLEKTVSTVESILVIDIPDEGEFVGARDDVLLDDTRRVPGSISEATGSASEFKISGSYPGS